VDADLRASAPGKERMGVGTLSWQTVIGSTHLVHGWEHFSHIDDTPQPFESKVAHADAPTGSVTRGRC
jgi:hypothetical protein